MNDANCNTIWSSILIEELVRSGVRHAVVSPGSRSAPLALACAEHAGLELHVALDERSAGFFALGLAQAGGAPALLVCTSGTAAANYLPAVLEADLGHVPLIALTADRPPEQRDCGAGQTVDQIGLYGRAVRLFAELPVPSLEPAALAHLRALAGRAAGCARRAPAGPVHLNLPFREPLAPRADAAARAAFAALPADLRGGREPRPWLLDSRGAERLQPDPQAIERLAAQLAEQPRGWIAVGALAPDPELPAALCALARALGWPILADPLSQLREGSHDRSLQVDAYDALLRDPAFAQAHAARACLRFGAMPTSKALRDRLESDAELLQVAVDPLAHREPTHRAQELLRADPLLAARALVERLAATARGPLPAGEPEFARRWLAAGRRARRALESALRADAPLCEPAVIAAAAASAPDGTRVFAGNSMPIRDLDSFWPGGSRRIRFLANRGANGIDGTLSTALGAAAAGREPLLAIVGDLALLHDWHAVLLAQRVRSAAVAIVVIDNGGGGIFEFLPVARELERSRFEQLFATPQGVDLESALQGFGAACRTVRSRRELEEALAKRLAAPGVEFIRVPVDRGASVPVHQSLFARAAQAAHQEGEE